MNEAEMLDQIELEAELLVTETTLVPVRYKFLLYVIPAMHEAVMMDELLYTLGCLVGAKATLGLYGQLVGSLSYGHRILGPGGDLLLFNWGFSCGRGWQSTRGLAGRIVL